MSVVAIQGGNKWSKEPVDVGRGSMWRQHDVAYFRPIVRFFPSRRLRRLPVAPSHTLPCRLCLTFVSRTPTASCTLHGLLNETRLNDVPLNALFFRMRALLFSPNNNNASTSQHNPTNIAREPKKKNAPKAVGLLLRETRNRRLGHRKQRRLQRVQLHLGRCRGGIQNNRGIPVLPQHPSPEKNREIRVP